MATIPDPLNSIAAKIDEYHASKPDRPRPHLGASQLGHPCDRWLWLSFRWAVQERFSGRMLRLFRRGQLEEETVVADLRAIGMDIRNTTGNQARVDFGSHVSGSMDGVIEYGIPEAPHKRHILEIKTHNKRSFDELVKKGVKDAKPQHYAQMQVYMLGAKIDRALYVAVCKDDDRLYTERVRLAKLEAEPLVERGHRIATSDRMPEPVSADPTWYVCKMCAAHSICHGGEPVQHVNCRTCAHSTAEPDSTWSCALHKAGNIPVDFQREGCESHVMHPDMVPWQLDGDASTEQVAVWVIDGKRVKNGAPAPGVYSSREVVANPALCASGDSTIERLRSEMGGRVAG